MTFEFRRGFVAGGALLLALLGLGIAHFSPPAVAQEVSASITGRITDASGAAIPGATVTVRHVAQGLDWTTQSNLEGIYAFPRVPVGTFELKVEMQGFDEESVEQLIKGA